MSPAVHASLSPTPRALARPLWIAGLALAALLVPAQVCGREARAFFEGDRATQDALAREVAAYVDRGVDAGAFHTGSPRFDAEWALGTHQMSILGLGQVVLEHPELRARYLPVMERAAASLVSDDTLAFGASAWGEDPIATLETSESGHAYLGYVALALGMLRAVDPETPHAPLHDRMVEALARRLAVADHALIETYPGEAYPCDVAAVAGAIGLHQRVTGVDRTALLERWGRTYRARWIDPSTGYLVQAGDARTGARLDAPRGSGTALAAYFTSFVPGDASPSRALHRAIAREGRTSLFGFGAVREHPSGHEGGGDIDSGPVVLGVSVSATGFALAGARVHGDRATYESLLRTAWLFGVPVAREGGGMRFVSGGPIGNAIMLAMLTARPAS